MSTKYVLKKISNLVIVMLFLFCAIMPASTLFGSGNTAYGVASVLMDLAGLPVFYSALKKLFE